MTICWTICHLASTQIIPTTTTTAPIRGTMAAPTTIFARFKINICIIRVSFFSVNLWFQSKNTLFTDCLDSSTPNMGMNSSMGGYGSPYKLCRQQSQSGIRERKRIQRSAPTGYFHFVSLRGRFPNFRSFISQKYQLSFWWAKSSCSNFSLREKVEQDRHPSASYSLHSSSQGSFNHRLWSFDLCWEVLERRNKGGPSTLEYKWWVFFIVTNIL